MRRAIAFFLTLCLLAGTLGGCRAREMKKIEEKASVDAIFRQWKDYLEEICSK